MSLALPLLAQAPIPLPDELLALPEPTPVPPPSKNADYLIGTDDLLNIDVFEFEDLSTSTRVTGRGFISLPLLNTVDAAGRTPGELENDIEEALRDGLFINDPQVTVFVEESSSQPVNMIGAVQDPGVYQMQGTRYLLDMLAMAGGLREEGAGRYVQIIRRPADDATDRMSQNIRIDLEALLSNDPDFPTDPDPTRQWQIHLGVMRWTSRPRH